MGCWYSKLDTEQMISRCRARKRYMKQFVKARHTFAAAHSMYLRSLRNTGSALLRFATAEANLHHLPPPNLSPPPSLTAMPPPPQSPSSVTSNSVTSTYSSIRPTPPPPPPPVVSAWDFWDPFFLSTGRSMDEEVWNRNAVDPEVVASVELPPPVDANISSKRDHELVLSGKSKDLVGIIQELDDYFLKAANAGISLSLLLDVPFTDSNRQTLSGKNCGTKPLLWTWGAGSAKWNAFGRFCEDYSTENKVDCLASDKNPTHRSTVERLCTWEEKLYLEVKNAENLKSEHEKRAATLKKLEMKDADCIRTDKAKKEVERLESQIMVSVQAIEAISAEIINLRESELYPQLLELVAGSMNMWRSMYEFHQVQMHIVQHFKHLICDPSTEPTSEIHRQSTLQLELEVQQWHLSLSNLMKAQRDYIQSLTGWLRLSLFQLGNNPLSKTKDDDAIYAFCEEWHLAINNAPEKTASEGLKSFLAIIQGIITQQAEEQKQRKRAELAFKELEKKADELRSLESKHGSFTTIPETSHETNKDPVREKRAKVEALRAKAEDERARYEKSVSGTRASTMSNLQMGLPHVFQAMTLFAHSCTLALESVHNQVKTTKDLHDTKK